MLRLANAHRVFGGRTRGAACTRRGTSGTASPFSLILAFAYPSRPNTLGSLSSWSVEKCLEHKRLWFSGTNLSRRQNIVHLFLLAESLGKLKKLTPHPFLCTLGQPKAAQKGMVAINPITGQLYHGVWLIILYDDLITVRSLPSPSRWIASMTSHAMTRRKLLFEYAYHESQILNASGVLFMDISTEIFGGILLSDNVLSIYHIKIKYKIFW